MRILLINPTIRENKVPYVFPIGIGIIAEILRNEGHEVLVYDQNGLRTSNDELCRAVADYKPVDVVALGGLITIYGHLKTLVPALRNVFPDTPFILGGGVTIEPDVVFDNMPIDICVHGEGENTMRELVAALESGEDFRKVQGISFRENEKLVYTEPRPLEQNLDAFPMPAYDLFPTQNYFRNNFINEALGRNLETHSMASLHWSRGCPNKCTFCWRMAGKTVRFRSPARVVEELKYLREHYDVDSYVFVDECINASRKMVTKFTEALIENDLAAPWYSHARVKPFDDEIAECLVRSGCAGLNFGVESASPKMLEIMNKNATPEQATLALDIAKAHGIRANCTFIIGMPGETWDTVRETVDWVKATGIKRLSLFYATPYPGCDIYKTPMVQNRIMEKYGDKDRFFSILGDVTDFVVNMTDYSDEEFLQMKQQATRDALPHRGYIAPDLTFRPVELLEPFFKTAETKGWNRIIIYGGGMHTVRILNAGDFSGYDILGIIDDNDEKWGQPLEGIEVISPDHALNLKPDAVLISSDRFENILYDKCGAFLKGGIAVVRPYKMHKNHSKS